MNTVDYLEEVKNLTAPTMDMHRALTTLAEKAAELDRINQRIDACTDSSFLSILESVRDAEKQHIVMVLEWWRRHDPKFNDGLRASLFKAGAIVVE